MEPKDWLPCCYPPISAQVPQMVSALHVLNFCMYSSSPMYATFCDHLIIHDFITEVIIGKEYKL
jgi:hypothetical protein